LPHVRRQAAQWAWWLLLVLVLIFGTAQRLAHVADQRRASADEGTYAQFTGRVAQLGLPASPWDRLSAMMGPRTKRVLVALLGVRVFLGGVTDLNRFTRFIVNQDVLGLTPPLLFEVADAW